ncbi:hypothetical protein D1872_329270 [compost metagenome]
MSRWVPPKLILSLYSRLTRLTSRTRPTPKILCLTSVPFLNEVVRSSFREPLLTPHSARNRLLVSWARLPL